MSWVTLLEKDALRVQWARTPAHGNSSIVEGRTIVSWGSVQMTIASSMCASCTFEGQHVRSSNRGCSRNARVKREVGVHTAAAWYRGRTTVSGSAGKRCVKRAKLQGQHALAVTSSNR